MRTRHAASPPNQRTSRLGYLPGLDGLRAVSVIAVMAFHSYFIGGHTQGFAPGGFLGVEVFFVVSGYLITALLLAERRDSKRISLKRFWIRRARRLLPALLVMLAVVVLYALLFLPDSIDKLKADTIAALTYTSNWWLVISHQSYAAEAGRPALLKHLWSLAIEEQFYLFWPPLLVLGLSTIGRRRLLGTMVVGALASTVLMAVVARGSITAAYYSTSCRLSGLLLGSAMAFFFAPYQIRGKPGRGVRAVLDLTGLLGMAVLVWSFAHFTFPTFAGNGLNVFDGGFLVVDLATLLVIASVVHPRSDGGPILGCRPLAWIGVRSYSLYLWHYPIFCVTRPGIDLPLYGRPLMALRLILSFGAADLSYRFVETPIRSGAIGRYMSRLRSAQGERRQRAARRGMVVALSSALVVIGLGAGLANAQGETPQIPGINARAHTHDKGSSVDSKTIAEIRARNRPTSTTSGPPTSRPQTATSTPHTALSGEVLAVGDSVMLGAVHALQTVIPGIFVDAKVSRQFWDATVVLQAYKNERLLPPTVVIHMGTNGSFTDAQFEDMMAVLGPKRQVFFVNEREPRPWESEVDLRLRVDVSRYPNAHLIDWHDVGNSHPEWFVADQIHLTGAGSVGYAALIKKHLELGR